MLKFIRIVSGRTAPLHGRPLGTLPAVDYVQGQSPEPRIREYFYYIDHEGYVSGFFARSSRNRNDAIHRRFAQPCHITNLTQLH